MNIEAGIFIYDATPSLFPIRLKVIVQNRFQESIDSNHSIHNPTAKHRD